MADLAGSGSQLQPAVAAIRGAVRTALADLDAGMRVLVACSGGPDSMALAAATAFEAPKAGWLAGAVVVDHGLQAGSADVAAAVAARLVNLGLDPVDVVAVRVGSTGGPEAAARAARFEALEAAASRAGAIVVLGHTRDDQAETVLLGLARGSGSRSLAGMAPVSGVFRRPLLGISRDETRAACLAMNLETWHDPHNDDPRYARVRVRKRVLPVLEAELGPGIAAALSRTAALARADADALDALAEPLLGQARQEDGSLDLGPLERAPAALVGRVIRAAAIAAGSPATDLFAVHVEAVRALITDWHGQAGVDLPGHVRVHRAGPRLRFTRQPG
jgi:tRNA(Ile)-lysidine synthase